MVELRFMGDFLSFSSPLSERLRVWDLVLPSSSLPRMWVLAWGRGGERKRSGGREGEGREEKGREGRGREGEGEGVRKRREKDSMEEERTKERAY